MNLDSEARRLQARLQSLRRTYRIQRAAIVWAPERGRWPPRFSVLRVDELERLKYMQADPWRLVGVYTPKGAATYLAEDLAAWAAEYAAAMT